MLASAPCSRTTIGPGCPVCDGEKVATDWDAVVRRFGEPVFSEAELNEAAAPAAGFLSTYRGSGAAAQNAPGPMYALRPAASSS